jgi:hypothetical protein
MCEVTLAQLVGPYVRFWINREIHDRFDHLSDYR